MTSYLANLGIWSLLSTGIFAIAYCATWGARRTAALRHAIWVSAFCAAALLPALTQFVPARFSLFPPKESLKAAPAQTTPDILDETAAAGNETIHPEPTPLDWTPIFSGLGIAWAAGTLFIVVRIGLGFAEATILRRRSVQASMAGFGFDDPSSTVGVKRSWELRVSQNRKPPAAMTWGIIRPIVILPKDSSNWAPDRVETVLRHELVHVRRMDSLTQLLALAICALYWFNPFIWLAARALHADAEQAADDGVIRSGVRPSDYATELLRLATEFGAQRQPLTNIGVSILKHSPIETRILSIVDPTRRRRGIGRLEGLSVATLGFAAALAFVAIRPAVAQDKVPPAPPSAAGQGQIPPSRPAASSQIPTMIGVDPTGVDLPPITQEPPRAPAPTKSKKTGRKGKHGKRAAKHSVPPAPNAPSADPFSQGIAPRPAVPPGAPGPFPKGNPKPPAPGAYPGPAPKAPSTSPGSNPFGSDPKAPKPPTDPFKHTPPGSNNLALIGPAPMHPMASLRAPIKPAVVPGLLQGQDDKSRVREEERARAAKDKAKAEQDSAQAAEARAKAKQDRELADAEIAKADVDRARARQARDVVAKQIAEIEHLKKQQDEQAAKAKSKAHSRTKKATSVRKAKRAEAAKKKAEAMAKFDAADREFAAKKEEIAKKRAEERAKSGKG